MMNQQERIGLSRVSMIGFQHFLQWAIPESQKLQIEE
jgi:hypothetical protein